MQVHEKDDSVVFVAPHESDRERLSAINQQLQASAESPKPSGDASAGPAPRVTSRFASIPATMLRRLVLSGGEAADAIRTRRDELYRNRFPRIEPRYAEKCEACGSEYDSEQSDCPACGSTDLTQPDPDEKRRAKRLFESVNPAGQSLRDIAKRAEEDQWTTGVSTLVLEYEYYQATDSTLYREGEIYREEPTAIHRADPLTVKPVVDESGHPGGHWWTCPVHRDRKQDGPGRCSCGADLREVHFVEERTGDSDVYYLRDEVLTWAYPHPRLHGLDGIAPAAHIWLKQAILQLMDRYAGSFYDPDADRLPNQFMILHTSNPDQWEEELAKARDSDDQYRSPMFTNSYSTQDSVQPEVEVVDAMPDELLGQNDEMKSQFKSDIRQAFGISDIHDSDLEDAGGLNNEGLQLEVTDRSLASQMHDYREGWLDTLMKRLGFDGWRISFLPKRDVDADALKTDLEAASFVKQAGGEAEIVDGDLQITDFEVDLDDSDDPPAIQGARTLPGVGSPVPDAGGGGPAAGPAALQAEVNALEQALLEVSSAGAIEFKGKPVYTNRDDVPPNVQNRIETAIQNHDFSQTDAASMRELKTIFSESLTQPQGWSIDSITDRLVREANIGRDRARTIAQTEATGILNTAREDAVADLAENVGETVLHYWDGPQDEDTTEMCEWLKEQTNPEYGGDPVPMDELRELQREAIDRFSDQDPTAGSVRDHLLHPSERHTHRSVLESELDG